MFELYNETKSTVKECWLNRKSSYLMNLLQIIMVIIISVLALPAVIFLKDRVEFGVCYFIGSAIWISLFKLAQQMFF